MLRARKFIIRLIIIWGVIFGLYYALTIIAPYEAAQPLGMSFDPVYSRYLGFEPVAAFTTMLDDWHFKYMRVPLHWDQVEPAPGRFDFTVYDKLMALATSRKAKVILSVGQKTPRWPECHLPKWATGYKGDAYQNILNEYIKAAIERYRNNPALEIWQVENEPFLPFGDCPAFTAATLKNEIQFVKSLDPNHPTITSDSGELSTWYNTANAPTDYFGTTMYRKVWDPHIGYFSYNWLPAGFYRLKLALYGRPRESAMVIELQAEPWIPNTDTTNAPLAEQYKSMTLDQLKKNIDYVHHVGFARTYLWGGEWWMWLAKQGNPSFVDFARTMPKD